MRVFRTSYKDKDGQKRICKNWYIELKDHLQTVRRFPAFTDKAASEALGRQIERLVNYRVAGEQPDAALSRWLGQIPARMRQRFADIGLLDAERASGGKPLAEHLADFRMSLQAKGNTPAYVELIISRISKVFKLDFCHF